MNRFWYYVQILKTVSIIKTLYFNFKAFKFLTAIHLPVIVGKKVVLKRVGRITLKYKGKKIHLGSANLFNTASSIPTIWYNLGNIIFNGPVMFYPGSTIYVTSTAILEFGGNNRFGKNTSLLCTKKIKIGHTSGFSWDCQIADSDFHFIENMESLEIKPRSASIYIGNNVWCGNRVMIGKGVFIADNCICGMNTFVNKSCEIPNSLLLGIPAKIHSGRFRRIFDINEEKSLISKLG